MTIPDSRVRAVTTTLVVPCHNEEAVIATTAMVLIGVLEAQLRAGRCRPDSQVLFVDDGSTDKTWSLIEGLAAAHPGRVAGLRLSRNVGHQHALLAGLTNAPGEVLISLDADLQDDVTVIPQMLDLYSQGHDIVYGVRSQRGTDTAFKRISAAAFYRLMRRIGVDVIYNHADYRLMSRRAIEILCQYDEVNLFLRGIVRLIGLPSASVSYERQLRQAGETKYSLYKMCALAIQGITSFSIAPLRFISLLGIIASLLALCGGAWALIVALTNPAAVPGWASIVLPVMLIGGLQILSIGVLGEYIGKIYMETKRRPRFIVERTVGVEASAQRDREE